MKSLLRKMKSYKINLIIGGVFYALLMSYQNAGYDSPNQSIVRAFQTSQLMFDYLSGLSLQERLKIKNLDLHVIPGSSGYGAHYEMNGIGQGMVVLEGTNDPASPWANLSKPYEYLLALSAIGHEFVHHVALIKGLDNVAISTKRNGGFLTPDGVNSNFDFIYLSEAMAYSVQGQIDLDFASRLMQNGDLILAQKMMDEANINLTRSETFITAANEAFDAFAPQINSAQNAFSFQILGTSSANQISGYNVISVGNLKISRVSSEDPSATARFSITNLNATGSNADFSMDLEIRIEPGQSFPNLTNWQQVNDLVTRLSNNVSNLKSKVIPETSIATERLAQRKEVLERKLAAKSGVPATNPILNSNVPAEIAINNNFNFSFYKFNVDDIYKNLPNSVLGPGPIVVQPITFLTVEVLGFGDFSLPEEVIGRGW